MTDSEPAWMNPEQAAIETYFQRAAFAFSQALGDGVDPRIKSMTLAFCLRAGRGLKHDVNFCSLNRSQKDGKAGFPQTAGIRD